MNIQQQISSAVGPLLKVLIPSANEGGSLPHDQWDRDLMIYVPNSDGIVAGSIITLTVNTASLGAAHKVTATEADNPDFKFEFSLDHSNFPAGNPATNVNINYTVYNPDTGQTTSSPFTYKLVFDKQAPGGDPLAYIGFTPEQLAGVSPDDVAEGYFSAALAPWSGMAVGDILTPWLGAAPPDAGNAASGLLTATQITIGSDDLGRPVTVRFPKSALEALGNVPQHFGYRLQDNLGNESSISPAREIEVNLAQTRRRPPVKSSGTLPEPRVTRRQEETSELYPPTVANLRPSDGRLLLADLSKPIVVTIPMPSNPVEGNQAQLFVNGYEETNAIGDPVYPPAVGESFTLEIAVKDFPPDAFPFVEWQLDYRYYDPVSGEGRYSYDPITLIFDRSAPGGITPTPGPIAFTPQQLSGISKDDIDYEKGGLPVHIAAWNDEDIDDQVELWLGTAGNAESGAYLPGVINMTTLGTGLEAVFPLAELEKMGNNLVYFGYRVTDWSGNISNLSSTLSINLYLNDVPTDLLAPLVPDAAPYNPEDGSGLPAGTGLLIWTEANPDTIVQIPTFKNVKVGDEIAILWNTQTVKAVSVTQADIDGAVANGYLVQIEVPFSYVQAGPPGANIPVSYRVSRGDTPEVTSPRQFINVNLTTPGGPDPDPNPETPEHENLKPLEVLSTAAGSVINIIPPTAYELAANITVQRAGVDNKPVWLIGDILTIYWGPAHEDDPEPVEITAANEPSNIVVNLPVGFIKTNGTGVIPVSYTLTRDLGNGNLVTVKSIDTLVTVQSPDEAPGGTAPLLPANFPESKDPIAGNPNRFIQRAAGIDGTTLQIPLKNAAGAALENVKAGDLITVDFYGVNDPLDGAGHDSDPGNPEIPESRISVADYVILPGDITRGYYEVSLPYTKTYYICRNLSVTKYSIKNAAGITKNAPDTLILFALNRSGGVCDVPV